jgi:hypothetical protein
MTGKKKEPTKREPKASAALQRRLIDAARAGQLDDVRALLAEGADPYAVSAELDAIITVALEQGDAAWLRRHAVRILDPSHPNALRAREAAESLGEVEVTSSSIDAEDQPVAWGYYVPRAESVGGKPLALGASAACSTVVLMPGVPDRGLASAVVAKTIARVAGKALRVGGSVHPAVADYGSDIGVDAFAARWELVEPRRIALGLTIADSVFARPIAGRIIAEQRERETLERCAARLRRLHELAAPAIIIEKDEQNVRAAYERLAKLGWSAQADPIPDDLKATIESARATKKT